MPSRRRLRRSPLPVLSWAAQPIGASQKADQASVPPSRLKLRRSRIGWSLRLESRRCSGVTQQDGISTFFLKNLGRSRKKRIRRPSGLDSYSSCFPAVKASARLRLCVRPERLRATRPIDNSFSPSYRSLNGRGGVVIMRKRIVGSMSLSPYSLGCIVAFLLPPACLLCAQTAPPALGLFQSHADIGTVLHPGSAQYDAVDNSYSLTGSGENMWFTYDEFQFAWKQVTGDIALTADIAFPEKGGNPHRKAVLMIRQSLDADAPYADVALHGDGLTSLQFREAKGSITHEIQSNLSAPHRLRLEKRGDVIYIFVAGQASEPLRPSGASITLPLEGSFYVGIGVCSHDKNAVEKAVFSNVEITTPAASTAPPVLFSALETVTVSSTDRRVVYVSPTHFEAPNWSRDGTYYLFNSDGHILQLPVAGGTPAPIDTGSANRCNNDHGISPDGQWLAISDSSQTDSQSSIYIVPIAGGTPRRVTQNSPSYWHGLSPDGKTLAYCAQRNGEFDIYTIP